VQHRAYATALVQDPHLVFVVASARDGRRGDGGFETRDVVGGQGDVERAKRVFELVGACA
jgi:hypothetical protein